MHEQSAHEIANEINVLLDKYRSFTSEFEPFSTFPATAQYMLFSRSCNAFRSASILCWEGLFVDSYNSARVGLETGWLALVLQKERWPCKRMADFDPSDTLDLQILRKNTETHTVHCHGLGEKYPLMKLTWNTAQTYINYYRQKAMLMLLQLSTWRIVNAKKMICVYTHHIN